MSATLDTRHWEHYFSDMLEPSSMPNDSKKSVAVVDVPDTRRFPIDIFHLGEPGFPAHLGQVKRLMTIRNQRKNDDYSLDDELCEATAELAVHVFSNELDSDGSILCFLPGIQEIRDCDRMIRSMSRHGRSPKVVYLHSSLSSQEQRQAFQPGPKIILSTNIAETSLTIPDIKVVIDSGRERQFSLLDSTSTEDISVVGSQLTTVTISQASAKQRAGRAGRVSAGTCYRLYTRNEHDLKFETFTKPEMLRMDLSSLVLHSLSACSHGSQESLHLLLNTPDPPSMPRLQQTLQTLEYQGLLIRDPEDMEVASLTPLGRVVSTLPASPRIGRMLFMGLALGAIGPALQMASLLSVPKVFSVAAHQDILRDASDHCSDIVSVMEEYQRYINDGKKDRNAWNRSLRIQFDQVLRVQRQLESALSTFLRTRKAGDWKEWNHNSHRVGALAGLVCVATPHIAHLVSGRNSLATRDSPGTARIHPSSINFDPSKRAHWYLYHELRTTSQPYLHLTTAASPLELALFSEASNVDLYSSDWKEHNLWSSVDWLYIADQWVPVEVSAAKQRSSFIKLRKLLMDTMLQELAEDPASIKDNAVYREIVLYVIAAIEHHRLPK
jgi:HrpA-like RNA helicase